MWCLVEEWICHVNRYMAYRLPHNNTMHSLTWICPVCVIFTFCISIQKLPKMRTIFMWCLVEKFARHVKRYTPYGLHHNITMNSLTQISQFVRFLFFPYTFKNWLQCTLCWHLYIMNGNQIVLGSPLHTIKFIPETAMLFLCWKSKSFHLNTGGGFTFYYTNIYWTGSSRTFIVHSWRTAPQRVRERSEFGRK